MPAYRAACRAAASGGWSRPDPERFGLHRFEPFELGVPEARPIWRAEVDPSVLRADAFPFQAGDAGCLDIAGFASLVAAHRTPDGKEHWLFSDGMRQIRLDLAQGTLTAGPVELTYRLAGLSGALPQIATLQRLIVLSRTGRLMRGQFPPERRAKRWALVLRTWDALAAGMSQREIASELFCLGDMPCWRTIAPSWRRRVQRLVAAARRAAMTEPSLWLQGRFP
jgi:hypothetical protein